jgi:hypothetical protein
MFQLLAVRQKNRPSCGGGNVFAELGDQSSLPPPKLFVSALGCAHA